MSIARLPIARPSEVRLLVHLHGLPAPLAARSRYWNPQCIAIALRHGGKVSFVVRQAPIGRPRRLAEGQARGSSAHGASRSPFSPRVRSGQVS